jgi:AAA+ superfamily predicted ATPase
MLQERVSIICMRQDAGRYHEYMTTLTLDEQKLQEEALNFARKNKKAIARRLTDPAIFVPESNPVSVFMAGSPGAGKTESSKEQGVGSNFLPLGTPLPGRLPACGVAPKIPL